MTRRWMATHDLAQGRCPFRGVAPAVPLDDRCPTALPVELWEEPDDKVWPTVTPTPVLTRDNHGCRRCLEERTREREWEARAGLWSGTASITTPVGSPGKA